VPFYLVSMRFEKRVFHPNKAETFKFQNLLYKKKKERLYVGVFINSFLLRLITKRTIIKKED